jgi:ankyrin repeat protein
MTTLKAKQFMACKRTLQAQSCPNFAQFDEEHSDDLQQQPKKRQRTEDSRSPSSQNPTDVALAIFKEHGIDDPSSLQCDFVTPTPDMIKGYTMETTKAVRDGNLKKIKELHRNGVSLSCCNRFGDTLLHIACRRGDLEMVQFLLEEANVPVNVKDDTHRTPLHDALWTTTPCFELVALLLKYAPEHIFMADIRGSRPFEYSRKVHCDSWCEFLSKRKDLLKPKKRCISPPSSPR